ncbi:MAG: serine hydrolase domain-containing protein, partial [Pseudomonadota bacterium]
IGGYGGYRPSREMPTLIDILNGTGNANANEGPVRIVQAPGTIDEYSGGGFSAMEQSISEAVGGDPRVWMDRNVLQPMGMSRSTFALTPEQDQSELASGHDGRRIPGHRWQFPAAAAGLYTTVQDLCQMIICINQGGLLNGSRLFQANLIEEMLTVQPNSGRGLGVDIPTGRRKNQNNFWYQHTGRNTGFLCRYRAYPNQNSGVVVMINQEQASGFSRNVIDAVTATYGWE